MFDSPGLPDYPPERNAWQFPPPPISPRWRWAAIAATIVGLVGGTALVVVLAVVGSDGAPGAIDNTRLISVIESECDLMTSRVESVPVTGSPRQQAQAITDQDHSVDDMVSAIRAEGPDVLADDPPTRAWLDDWERLVAARETYAELIRGGATPDLDIPDDEDGHDIHLRMNDVWLGESACEVPRVLIYPYPEDVSEV